MHTRPFALLLPALALLAGCHRIPSADRDAAIELVKRNTQLMQEEKIDAMMATLHPTSPAYASTRAMMEDLAAKFDLKCEVSDIAVLSLTDGEMKVRFTQTMEKIAGDEPFPKTRVHGIHILKKDGPNWKIASTQMLKVENLEPPIEEPAEPPAPPDNPVGEPVDPDGITPVPPPAPEAPLPANPEVPPSPAPTPPVNPPPQ